MSQPPDAGEIRAFWLTVGGQFADYERLSGEHVDLKTAFGLLCEQFAVNPPPEVFAIVREGYRQANAPRS